MTPDTHGPWKDWRAMRDVRHGNTKVDLREAVILYGLQIGKVQGAILCRLLDGEADWRELSRAVSAHRPAKMGAIHEAISALNSRFGGTVISGQRAGRVAGSYSLTSLGRSLCVRAVEHAEIGLVNLKAEIKG